MFIALLHISAQKELFTLLIEINMHNNATIVIVIVLM